jgi:hypothetical protein
MKLKGMIMNKYFFLLLFLGAGRLEARLWIEPDENAPRGSHARCQWIRNDECFLGVSHRDESNNYCDWPHGRNCGCRLTAAANELDGDDCRSPRQFNHLDPNVCELYDKNFYNIPGLLGIERLFRPGWYEFCSSPTRQRP